MTPHRLGCLLVLPLLAACGDNGGTGTTDAGNDATDDIAVLPDADASTGDTSDTSDADNDTETDGAGPDADAAGDTDTDAGPDCEPPPPACTTDDDCDGDNLCATGACVAPITRETFAPTGELLEVLAVDFPGLGETIGFDLDGDGSINNVVGTLVGPLPGGPERIEAVVNEAFATGTFGLAAELVRDDAVCGSLPGSTAADVLFHFVTRDLDRDGLLNDDERAADAPLQVLPSGLTDDRGPRCRLADGSWLGDDERVEANGGSDCAFVLPLLDGTTIQLPVRGVHVSAALATLSTKEGEVAPNAAVGGYVAMEDVVSEINRLAPGCACAGINTAEPLAELYSDGDRVAARCLQDVAAAESCTDTSCSNLPALCTSLTVLGFNADIRSGGDGTPLDGVSFGFGAVVEPAPVDEEEPTAPTLVAFGDHHAANRALRMGPGQTSLSAAVLNNDQFDPGVHSLQSITEHSPAEVPIAATIVGDRVQIELLSAWEETDQVEVTLSYTVGDGAAQSSSADLTFLISRITLAPDPVADELVVRLGGGTQTLDVLANDIRPEGTPMGLRGVALDGAAPVPSLDSEVGTISLAADRRTLSFAPTALGTAEFEYIAYAWSPTGGDSPDVRSTVFVFVDCPVGTFGEDCGACDDCGERVCDDGRQGSGACICPPGFVEDETCTAGSICVDGCRPITCGDGVVDSDIDEQCDPAAPGGEFCTGLCEWIPCADGDLPRPLFADNDFDGFGAPGATVTACPVEGYSDVDTDCDDADPDTSPEAREYCWDGVDNNCNLDVDCDDPRCTYDGECFEYTCWDERDNDGDGLIDCLDPDCAIAGTTACYEFQCSDGLDNDADGFIDCRDADCRDNTEACYENDCADGSDNDGNGLTDCADLSCADRDGCAPSGSETCNNDTDDDDDGLTDCEDPDCSYDEACREICNDGIDNNFNGRTDCRDFQCVEDEACLEYDCTDGIDDNGNGLIDCLDPACAGQWGCAELECSAGIDNDGDGLLGCDDSDCLWFCAE